MAAISPSGAQVCRLFPLTAPDLGMHVLTMAEILETSEQLMTLYAISLAARTG